MEINNRRDKFNAQYFALKYLRVAWWCNSVSKRVVLYWLHQYRWVDIHPPALIMVMCIANIKVPVCQYGNPIGAKSYPTTSIVSILYINLACSEPLLTGQPLDLSLPFH